MKAFLDKRDFMAELEGFEKHLLRSGITTSKDGVLADLPPLVARREDACQSVVEPQGPRPVEARRNDEDSGKSEPKKLESVRRSDFAAIEAEFRHPRQDAARAEPLGIATSNVTPNFAGELKSRRHVDEIVVSNPVGIVNERPASRRSIYVMAGIVVAGLAGLGLGNAFWSNASNPSDFSSINAESGLAIPPSQVATSVDMPAQQPSAPDSSVSSPPATSSRDAEQLVDASRQQVETPPAAARRGETGPENQTVGAPASPMATQMQAVPAGKAAVPEPKKAETASVVAPPDPALRTSDAPAQAAAAPPSPPRAPAAVAPASNSENGPTSAKGAETLCLGQIGRSAPARANCEASQNDGHGEGRAA